MNLLAPFFAEAESRASQTAIIDGKDQGATFGDLVSRSGRLASAWRRKGIGEGDRVLLAMPLGIPLYVSLLALWRLGAVVVFPEPALGLRGLRHAVAATAPKALLAGGWFGALRYLVPALRSIRVRLSAGDAAEGVDALSAVAAEHPALISFTSGSTGRPKAIVRSHGFLARQNACVADLLRPQGEAVDIVAFPVFVLANLGLGVTSVLPDWNLRRHDAANPGRIAAQIARHRVTRALVPPSICEKLAVGPPTSLAAIFTGGGPVFPDLLQRLSAAMPRADIVSVYGSTEAEPIAHQHASDITASDWAAMRGGAGLLAGRPVPQIGLTLLEDEIVVAGDHVNKGYLDPADDASTKLPRDGEVWHRTGDAGRMDAAGRLWLLGRLDGRAGGHFPFCVEAAARLWPEVTGAALVELDGRAVLAVSGDPAALARWQALAERIGDIRVVPVKAIPLDRRHRSKIDYPALRTDLTQA